MSKAIWSHKGVIYFDLHIFFLVYMAYSNSLGCIFFELFCLNVSVKVMVGTWGIPRRIPEMLTDIFSTGDSNQQSMIWRKEGKKKKKSLKNYERGNMNEKCGKCQVCNTVYHNPNDGITQRWQPSQS